MSIGSGQRKRDARLPAKLAAGKQQHKMQRHEGAIVHGDPPDAPLPHVEFDLSWSHILRAIPWHDCSYLLGG